MSAEDQQVTHAAVHTSDSAAQPARTARQARLDHLFRTPPSDAPTVTATGVLRQYIEHYREHDRLQAGQPGMAP